MADAKSTESAESAVAPKKKKKLMLFIIIGVLVLAIAGAGGVWFIKKKKAASEDGDEEPTKEETKKSKKSASKEIVPPVFVKLEAFTVKLQSEGQESYLQTTPELRVGDVKIGEQVKAFTPEIRHKVLLILSGKKASDLTNPQGVERLSNELRMTINAVLDPATAAKRKKKEEQAKAKGGAENAPVEIPEADPDDPVQAVLFTSFIVQ